MVAVISKEWQEFPPEPEGTRLIQLEVYKAEGGDGVTLRVKSPFIHSWFKSKATGEPQPVPEWNTAIYRLSQVPTLLDATLASPGTSILMDGQINLTFLRSIHLNEGVELTEKIPPSEQARRLLFDSVRAGVSNLWREHIRNVALKGLLLFREVATEEKPGFYEAFFKEEEEEASEEKEKPMKHIHRVGIELEGGWDKPAFSDVPIILDESIKSIPLNFRTKDGCKHRGEVQTPVGGLPLLDAIEWTKVHYPDGGNEGCAMHIHFSTSTLEEYGELMTPAFYFKFLSDLKRFGQDNLTKDDIFWHRLNGQNKYCTMQFRPLKQALRVLKHPHPDDHARRGILNFCFRIHGTVECRVWPLFPEVDLAIKAIYATLESVNSYLDSVKPEYKRLKGTIRFIA